MNDILEIYTGEIVLTTECLYFYFNSCMSERILFDIDVVNYELPTFFSRTKTLMKFCKKVFLHNKYDTQILITDF